MCLSSLTGPSGYEQARYKNLSPSDWDRINKDRYLQSLQQGSASPIGRGYFGEEQQIC